MSLIAAASAILVSLACAAPPPAVRAKSVLVFSKTTAFRHASIPHAIKVIKALGTGNGFKVDATENAATFTRAKLKPYAAVVFLSTTGDVLNGAQQGALKSFVTGAAAGSASTRPPTPRRVAVVRADAARHLVRPTPVAAAGERARRGRLAPIDQPVAVHLDADRRVVRL